MILRNRQTFVAMLAVFALALGACSESTTPDDVGPAVDTTAPVVAGTTPVASAIQVATTATVQVTFNEDMAPASSVGQVTLSSGGTPTLVWANARTLTVSHGTAWAEGVAVTVNVGTGLTDVAGNALAAVHAFSFFTATSAFLLTATEPLDTATAVSRSGSVRLQFSQTPDLSSVADHVTITDANVKTVHPFTASDGGGNGWVVLAPVSDLPATTLITVSIGAEVHVSGSPQNTFGEAYAFHFTTGVTVDTTPPTILSFSPANGTTNVAADIGALTITFSEPINTETFVPASLNFEFYLAIGSSEPVWSQGNTVMTVALPTLPVGLEMEIMFVNYQDGSGNPQSTPTTWDARVAGTADIFPMTTGIRHYMYGSWSSGLTDSLAAPESGDREEFRQLELQLNGDMRVVAYNDTSFTTPRRWDTYDRLASVINWLGFADGGGDSTLAEINFDTPVKFLPLPMVIGPWSGSTTVTVPGEGSYQAVTTGRVIGREDLPLGVSKLVRNVYYKDAWKVARSMVVSLDGAWFTTMTDTTWYSPTLGPVREISYEDSAARGGEPAGWYRSDMWRDPTRGR